MNLLTLLQSQALSTVGWPGFLLVILELFCVTQAALAFDEKPAIRNTQAVLGQPCNQPYIVAIPVTSPTLLDQVQRFVPTAFLTNSPFGMYVLAGSYSALQPAKDLNRQLRQQGLDARVIYKPLICGVGTSEKE